MLLDALPDAIANERPILIVKAKVSADRLAKWDVAAIYIADGIKNKKWEPEAASFRNADVLIVPDDVGWKHLNVIGTALAGIAKRVRVLILPGLREKGGMADWILAGGTHEQLYAEIAKALDWKPLALGDVAKDVVKDVAKIAKEEKAKATQLEDELIANLAKLPPGIQFGQEAKRLARQYHVARSDIEDEVQAYRIRAELDKAAPLYGHWNTEPWPEPVDGDSLLRDIIRRIHRHVVCSFDAALTAALWTMQTWVHDEAATHSPILAATSPDLGSGKTTLLDLIALLALRCLASVEISEAALYRSIELWQPSFVVDEFDNVLANKDRTALRSIINSGHVRGQGVVRCVAPDYTPQLFKTFAPKAIGLIGRRMPVTTLSRCIFIELKKKKKDEDAERFLHKDDPELADLRRRLFRWSLTNATALASAKPSMPSEFDNRVGDNWYLLLAIADLCSGVEDFGDKARMAAIKIESGSDNRTIGVCLLADIKAIFYPKNEKGDDLPPLERISSENLAAQLCTYSDSRWAEWKNGKSITAAQLARLLRPFGIAPEVIRLPNSRSTIRGYLKTQFEDAWERYL